LSAFKALARRGRGAWGDDRMNNEEAHAQAEEWLHTTRNTYVFTYARIVVKDLLEAFIDIENRLYEYQKICQPILDNSHIESAKEYIIISLSISEWQTIRRVLMGENN
jgi:hypothetical protein